MLRELTAIVVRERCQRILNCRSETAIGRCQASRERQGAAADLTDPLEFGPEEFIPRGSGLRRLYRGEI